MKYLFALLAVICFIPQVVFAHTPTFVEESTVDISDAHAKQVFYSRIQEDAQTYTIHADKPIELYIALLVPDTLEAYTDISVMINTVNTRRQFADALNGKTAQWQPYKEEYSGDIYLLGPEFGEKTIEQGQKPQGMFLPYGTYTIRVEGEHVGSPYALVIGGGDAFVLSDNWQTAKTLMTIKKDFFDQSFWTIFQSPLGFGLFLFLFASVVIIGGVVFVYRRVRV
ncbi:hypothetical protein KKG22_04450 [Patescibacteria group bacterium]|nr:hypothetical protein [Patescibacteria group bacterium]MBU1721393.1 hypothetical protein [Patescibacteria group bacterium]MBU1901833.1 hypothetical protein [Patescibacteria group bacterium]